MALKSFFETGVHQLRHSQAKQQMPQTVNHMKRVRVPKAKKEKSTEKSSTRDETPLKKSVIFPAYVWEAVASEAKRQRRTLTGQVEFIVVCYFRLDNDLENDKEKSLDARPAEVVHLAY